VSVTRVNDEVLRPIEIGEVDEMGRPGVSSDVSQLHVLHGRCLPLLRAWDLSTPRPAPHRDCRPRPPTATPDRLPEPHGPPYDGGTRACARRPGCWPHDG